MQLFLYLLVSAGVVALHCSDKLPDSTQKLAEFLQNEVRTGSFRPFQGPIYAQGGQKIIGKDEVLSTQQIMDMDWLADNVVGTIPAYEELNETGKATVGIVGVEPATKEKQT